VVVVVGRGPGDLGREGKVAKAMSPSLAGMASAWRSQSDNCRPRELAAPQTNFSQSQPNIPQTHAINTSPVCGGMWCNVMWSGVITLGNGAYGCWSTRSQHAGLGELGRWEGWEQEQEQEQGQAPTREHCSSLH